MRRLALMLLAAALALCGCARTQAAAIEIVFFDAGKADAILIQTPGSAVLVDAGLEKDGAALADKIRARGVTALDALIVTHFDKDHVGGADKVLDAFAVKRALQPSYSKDSKQYRQYLEALSRQGLSAQALEENLSFSLDGVDYNIDVANEADYGPDEENDFSLVVRLRYKNARALLPGDAEQTRLGELLQEGDLACGLLKAPHHGRHNNLSEAFYGAARPEICVVTSSEAEPEDPRTLSILQDLGARVLLTRNGDVLCRSDGEAWRAEGD